MPTVLEVEISQHRGRVCVSVGRLVGENTDENAPYAEFCADEVQFGEDTYISKDGQLYSE